MCRYGCVCVACCVLCVVFVYVVCLQCECCLLYKDWSVEWFLRQVQYVVLCVACAVVFVFVCMCMLRVCLLKKTGFKKSERELKLERTGKVADKEIGVCVCVCVCFLRSFANYHSHTAQSFAPSPYAPTGWSQTDPQSTCKSFLTANCGSQSPSQSGALFFGFSRIQHSQVSVKSIGACEQCCSFVCLLMVYAFFLFYVCACFFLFCVLLFFFVCAFFSVWLNGCLLGCLLRAMIAIF